MATDLTAALVSQGRTLCRVAGLEVDWCEADMEGLPFPDHTFDVVVCVFGIMYADSPATALGEFSFRVTRQGGTVGLSNWTPEGFQGQAAATVARYSPSRRRGHDPMDWGREERVLSWLKPYITEVHLERRAVWQEFASPDPWWEHASQRAPPLVPLRDVLGQERFAELGDELRGLLRAFDSGEPVMTRWPQEYLMVAARKGAGAEQDGAAQL